MIIVTPEKWDIITRKSGDRTYTQKVGKTAVRHRRAAASAQTLPLSLLAVTKRQPNLPCKDDLSTRRYPIPCYRCRSSS